MNRLEIGVLCVLMASCSTQKKETMSSSDTITNQLQVYSLENKNGLKMTVTNLGGRIISLWVPDKKGELADVVLGYDSVKQYINGNPFFGAMIGRFGNRIAKGKFKLDDKEYTLAINNGANALHGGPGGFHNVYWKVQRDSVAPNRITLSYVSSDGEEGYPGELTTTVVYSLNDNDELGIEYTATTNKSTVVNLTHHSFFNLAGESHGDILNHELIINADAYLPIDEGLIPTGELKNVYGTAFDFLKTHAIGERINGNDIQLQYAKGYDHNFVLNKKAGEYELAAIVSEPVTGRIMEVWTTEPGLQFYSGNFLDGKDIGKGNKPYLFRSAFCLEAQHFPDSPNHPNFPSTRLNPGETYHQKTVYAFSVVEK
jgi:aldose 1-epimerase